MAKHNTDETTLIRPGDFVLVRDWSSVVVQSVVGYTVHGYDESGDRSFSITDVVHIHYNLEDADRWESDQDKPN